MTSFSGWHVKDSILSELFEGNAVTSDERILENKLCDLDIRDFGEPSLSYCMNKEALTGPVVLQLIRYRNVSQPRLKDDLNSVDNVGRVSLTDGHISVSAILLDNLKGINADTPPGTKLMVSGVVNVENGFLILKPSNVTVIGGRVEKLVDKWMIERHSFGDTLLVDRSDYKAPRWISFGKQKIRADPSTLEFRANDVLKTASDKDANDECVFKQQRIVNIQAIKEGPKVFIAPKVQVPLKYQESNVTKKTKPCAPSDPDIDRRYKNKSVRHGGIGDDEELTAAYSRSSKSSTLFDFVIANVASEIVSDSNTPICSSTHGNVLNTRESKHSRHKHSSGRFDQQEIVRRNPLEKGSNYKQKKGKERTYGRTPITSVKNRESRQHTWSGDVFQRENCVNNNHVQSYSQKKPQHFSSNGRTSVRAETSKQVNHKSIRGQFQTGRTLNIDANSSKSQLNRLRKGDLTQDEIIQNFSNVCIGSSLRSVVEKKSPSSWSHKSLDLQKLPTWNVGEQCKAPWNDGMYYLATIVKVEPSGMCVVRYNDYGNTCTVSQGALLFEHPQH